MELAIIVILCFLLGCCIGHIAYLRCMIGKYKSLCLGWQALVALKEMREDEQKHSQSRSS